MATPNVILPEKGKENILITSALPYVNNVPHLGNIIGSLLSADIQQAEESPDPVHLRHRRVRHCHRDQGPRDQADPQELCDEFHAKHKEIYEWFELGFDYFGRTTTPKQTEIVQDIFLKLHKNGYLEERTTTQPYCEHPDHKAFLADRFVEGTCPKCQYDDARGDQCDKCGQLLDPLELINPKCKVDNTTPVPKDTTHIFLRLDKLSPEIVKWVEKSSTEGKWSSNGVAITKSWLERGLEGRSITRDLKWGVPVPLKGFENKVMYVWFDACIGYPSITANYTDEWEQWWRNPEDVKLYQFMGKDNVPFHTVIFPGSQIGTGDKWTQLNTISTCEYLNYENTKFSKSRGVGVFGDQVKETGIPPSVWRYYLLASRPETGDTQFMWADFVAANNNELLANFGNFCNRVIKFVNAKLEGKVPEFSASYTDESFDFPAWIAEVNGALKEYNDLMEGVHLRSGIKKVLEISSKGNNLLQYRLDNAALNDHPERTKTVIGLALNLCSLLASIASPYMPSTSPGHQIGKAAYLFSRIDDKKVVEWKEKYGGTQATRAAEEAAKKKKQEDKERKKARKAEKKAAEASTAAAKPEIDGTVKSLPIREKLMDKEGPLTTSASTVPESTAPKTE
ncbi:uncharacterized protein PG998_000271 [Apiospora kogelbergensis]|uniref:uncharacterized protein n=1 Tax=Apiospora kogelbergensis TaxID=1337665 RepID=UPI0031324945